MPSSTISKIKKSSQDNYLLPYIKALIAYAKSDSEFAESLAFHAQGLKQSNITITSFEEDNLIKLANRSEAVATARWIVNACNNTPYSTAILQSFANHYTAPKDFVIGIVGVAIIGPTLGIISSKKKRKSHLQVFVSNKYNNTLSKEKLSEITTEFGQKVLAKELRLAGGNVQNIHPDSADWLMCEGSTKVTEVSTNTLTEIANLIETEKLSGFIKRENGELVMVFVSPAVPDNVADELI